MGHCIIQIMATLCLATLQESDQQAETRGWAGERLKAMLLQALAHRAQGHKEAAGRLAAGALAQAEPAGFIRISVDEEQTMAQLVARAAERGVTPIYAGRLLAAFAAEETQRAGQAPLSAAQPLIEPLSERELEVLGLIALGYSNREIGQRLFLALDTV